MQQGPAGFGRAFAVELLQLRRHKQAGAVCSQGLPIRRFQPAEGLSQAGVQPDQLSPAGSEDPICQIVHVFSPYREKSRS